MRFNFFKSGFNGNYLLPSAKIDEMVGFDQDFAICEYRIVHRNSDYKYIYKLYSNNELQFNAKTQDFISYGVTDISTITLSNTDNYIFKRNDYSFFFGEVKGMIDGSSPTVNIANGVRNLVYGGGRFTFSSIDVLSVNDFFRYDINHDTTFIPTGTQTTLWVTPRKEVNFSGLVDNATWWRECDYTSSILFKLHKVHNDKVVSLMIFSFGSYEAHYDGRILSLKRDGSFVLSYDLESNGIDLTDGNYHYITVTSSDRHLLMYIDYLLPSYMSIPKILNSVTRSPFFILPSSGNISGYTFANASICPQEYIVECPFHVSTASLITFETHISEFDQLLNGNVAYRG